MTDLGCKGCAPSPIFFFIFIQFSAKIMSNNSLMPPSKIGAPPGSATVNVHIKLILWSGNNLFKKKKLYSNMFYPKMADPKFLL